MAMVGDQGTDCNPVRRVRSQRTVKGERAMPQVRIETRDHWLQGRNAQLFQAIQDGLVEGIKIPPDDQCLRLITYDAAHFPTPPGKTDRCMVIEIALVTGRTLAAKRAAYAAIARNIQAAFGIDPSDLRIVLEEVDLENWGINGKPASEL
jgi:phenylpyruvate tautomerase PptA (4-oxalocrotonate tautomerase family)